jgi:hypothetical protein
MTPPQCTCPPDETAECPDHFMRQVDATGWCERCRIAAQWRHQPRCPLARPRGGWREDPDVPRFGADDPDV